MLSSHKNTAVTFTFTLKTIMKCESIKPDEPDSSAVYSLRLEITDQTSFVQMLFMTCSIHQLSLCEKIFRVGTRPLQKSVASCKYLNLTVIFMTKFRVSGGLQMNQKHLFSIGIITFFLNLDIRHIGYPHDYVLSVGMLV